MRSPTHGSRLSTGAIIAVGLLLVAGAFFLVAVHRQVQANRGMLVSFEGFINYGSPIKTASVDAQGSPTTTVLTASRIDQPIFTTRKTLAFRMKSWWREWSLAAKQVLQDLRPGDRSPESPAPAAP